VLQLLAADLYIDVRTPLALFDHGVGLPAPGALLDDHLVPLAAADRSIRFVYAVLRAGRPDAGFVTNLNGTCRERKNAVAARAAIKVIV
jgi:hypothetical protein